MVSPYILTFARNRHLRKRTTYLIINLTIADLFVGTVSVPMHIYHTMTFESNSGFGWGKFIVLPLEFVFKDCSLLNLALLSLSWNAFMRPYFRSDTLQCWNGFSSMPLSAFGS